MRPKMLWSIVFIMSESQGQHHHHHHHHSKHKKHKSSSEDRMRLRKLNWRRVKKIIGGVLFLVLSVAALIVLIYAIYLWLFEPAEPLKEIVAP